MITNRSATMQTIKQHKLIAIIRHPEQSWVAGTIECLVNGNVKVLEVTSNTPNYAQEITLARGRYPNILIGAGTITTPDLAAEAIAAGAQFLVTPNVCEAVVEEAHKHDVPVLMGALTPTEIAHAISYKADAVKLFPAGEMGIAYCKGIMGPFNDISLFAVGGIHLENTKEWLNLGLDGVGIGNQLCKAVHNENDKHAVTAHALELVRTINEN